ncbi:MAG TPA: hypothetical protein VF088_21005 [Pyrinomonadaceae bacterium]
MKDDLEPERYELFAEPVYNFSFNRRQFLKTFSGGIALIIPMSNASSITMRRKH